MEREKQNFLYYALAVVLVLAGTAGGGYFCCVSSLLCVILMAVIVYLLKGTDSFSIACDLNLAAVLCLVAGYFVASLWAVDFWMALMGGIKFLPVFLFFFILCQIPEQRERLIRLLPLLGSLMTIFSFVMMQFSVFRMYVSAAGRLAGFFQYPNTYALFMLICTLVAIDMIDLKNTDWMCIGHVSVGLLGIYFSGSRTVFVLAVIAILVVLISKKELRRYGILGFLAFAGAAAILGLCGYGFGIITRLVSQMENASTFWGRLLYDRDAVKMIVSHPFGMGYYGYYFVQQEMQTGVYSVVSVHNELLQIMLDIGILPAVLLYGAIGRSLMSGHIPKRNRLILLVMLMHSLFDYDFQFLAMYFILLLFLDLKNIRKVHISILTKATAVAVLLATVCAFASAGISDFFYIKGDFPKAVSFYGGNTMAKIELLKEADSAEEMEQIADSILENNAQVSVAYSAKAQVAFAEGKVEEFIRYKLLAIQKAPYQYDEYIDYLDCLAYCAKRYLQAGDAESAKVCVEQARNIPRMLKEVGNRTSSLGWKINDRPEVALSQKDLERIEEMVHWIDED